MSEKTVRYRGKKKSEDKKAQDVTATKVSDDTTDKTQISLRNSFYLTRVIFLRSLAFIYFVAFLVSFHQNKELIGNYK